VEVRKLKLRIRLKELLKERNMNQKQLLEAIEKKTGKEFRAATISEIANNQRTTINREHLELIASVLEIKDVSELIELVDDDK
jgi:transcriptional regulator with XRE-family HTH domain